MRHTALLAVAAATLLSACSSGRPAPGGPSTATPAPADNPFRYDVPTPPTATYQLAETMTMVMTTPDGERDMAMASSSTVALTFAADPGGVRVFGAVSDYSANMASSMMGNTEMSGDSLSGNLEFVIGTFGNVEMISKPLVTGGGLPGATPFQFNASNLFPRFPGDPLEPGDTWDHTVTAAEDLSEVPGISGAAEDATVYTYTLVGDTVVADRTLQKITVSGVGTVQAVGEEAGAEMARDLSNTVEGFIHWDAERGLVAAAELLRTVDGSVSIRSVAMAMTMVGVSRLRLVN